MSKWVKDTESGKPILNYREHTDGFQRERVGGDVRKSDGRYGVHLG